MDLYHEENSFTDLKCTKTSKRSISQLKKLISESNNELWAELFAHDSKICYIHKSALVESFLVLTLNSSNNSILNLIQKIIFWSFTAFFQEYSQCNEKIWSQLSEEKIGIQCNYYFICIISLGI